MKPILKLSAAALALLMAPSVATAATVVDQSQTVVSNAFGKINEASFSPFGQSFKAGYDNSVGGGFFMANYGASAASGDVTIALRSAPGSSGTVLASGTAGAIEGNWVDVSWDRVALTAGTTYYLTITSPDSLYLAYGYGDVYPNGGIYANTYAYGPYYDLTFRTYADDAPAVATTPAAGAVPEAATWGMMILGMGMVGTALRRRRSVAARVSFG